MSLSLYTDVHVPNAVVKQLRIRGVNVLTAQEDGSARLPDDELLDRATHLGHVLVSQDADLLVVARHRQTTGSRFAGVIYAHQLQITIGRFVSDLELIASACDAQDIANRVEYLPL